jgi:hypothetical protein
MEEKEEEEQEKEEAGTCSQSPKYSLFHSSQKKLSDLGLDSMIQNK